MVFVSCFCLSFYILINNLGKPTVCGLVDTCELKILCSVKKISEKCKVYSFIMESFSEEDYLSHLNSSLFGENLGGGGPEDQIMQAAMRNVTQSDSADKEQTGSSGIKRNYGHLSLEDDPNKRDKVGNPFERGTNVFSDSNIDIFVKSIGHVRRTRFSLSDHLYNVTVAPKKKRHSILYLSLEKGLEEALTFIIERLKSVYARNLNHNIYVTLIERNMKSGLNTTQYTLATQSSEIAKDAITIFHTFLQSNPALTLNDSFRVQIKVLGQPHMKALKAKGLKLNIRQQKAQ